MITETIFTAFLKIILSKVNFFGDELCVPEKTLGFFEKIFQKKGAYKMKKLLTIAALACGLCMAYGGIALTVSAENEGTKSESVTWSAFYKTFSEGDFSPIGKTYAKLGLHASKNPKDNLLSMTGKKGDTCFYTTLSPDKEGFNTDTDCGVCFSPLQILTHDKTYAVVTAEAVSDVKVSVTVPQLTEGYAWVLDNKVPTKIAYWLDTGERVVKVKETNVVEKNGDYDYTAHLKKGETLYYSIYCEGWATVNLCPEFTFSDDYDSDWTYNEIKTEQESFVWEDMVSSQVLSNGGKQKNDLIDYQFLYGENLDSLTEFIADAGTSEEQHVLRYGERETEVCSAWRWQWRVSNPYICVIKIEATENIYLKIEHGKIDLGSYVPSVYLKTIVESPDGIRLERKRYRPKVINEENSYFTSEHLKKGDVLYAILEPTDRTNGSWAHTLSTYSESRHLTFTAASSLYDESKRADFEREKQLIEYRAAKVEEMNAYVAGLEEDDYTLVAWSEIQDFAAELESLLSEADSEEKADAVYAEVKAKIDAIQTIAETEAELAAYKTQKKAELAAYAKESDYTKENWATVQEYIASANESIDRAKTTVAVDTAVSSAKNRIDRVEKKAADEGDGCGSTLSTGTVVSAAALTAIAAILKKKRGTKGETGEK